MPEFLLQSKIFLTAADNGCENIYSDIASGVREGRAGLNEMLSYLRNGDTVLVYKTDRIFRSLKNMIELIEKFNEKGVFSKSLGEPAFDTTSANGEFIIQIFGAVAEFERNLISERTKAGIEGARRRKKLLGRPKGAKKGVSSRKVKKTGLRIKSIKLCNFDRFYKLFDLNGLSWPNDHIITKMANF